MNFLGTYFNLHQFLLLVTTFVFYGFSIVTFIYKEKKEPSVFLLVIATLSLGLFAITLDPYLNMWDEQFHALVAKNLSHDFLKPVLYQDPILPYDKNSWTENYIWLHKQPFFLWQMALSIKLFGVSVYAIRLPSLICFTFATFCTYRIGKNIANQSIGYISALFFSSNYFFVELIAGNATTDHNDIVFISYVTASIWAFTEYILNPGVRKWVYLIGLFAGIAVLTKWLAGLLIYSGWFVYIVSENRSKFYKLSNYKHFLTSLLTTFIVVLPWQLYIFSAFPEEAGSEYRLSSLHFSEVVEGHKGDFWFYYDSLNSNLGHFFTMFCFAGLILLRRFVSSGKIYITIISMLLIVLVFFSLAETKMDCFILISSGILFIAVGAITYSVFQQIQQISFHKISTALILIIGLFVNLNPERLQLKHTFWKENYGDYYDKCRRTEWKNFCTDLNKKLINDKYVVFNCPDECENISLMFYTDFLGYGGLPSLNNIKLLKQKAYKIVVVDNGSLPDTILNDRDLLIISAPQYKTVKTDTVFIKSKHFGFLSAFGEQAICNDSIATEVFTIRHFADSTCYIRNEKGAFATIDLNWKGRILFKKVKYSISERFRLEFIEEGTYKIRTADDNTVLQVMNKGEAICADDRPYLHDEEFQIIKKN